MELQKESTLSRAERAQAHGSAQLLIETLPWIKESTGKAVVVKYGGAAMTDEALRIDVMSDIVLLKLIGLNPIIVHGGGNDISDLCTRLGLPVEFKDGLRVTPPEVMDIVKMALIGKVNQELVAQLNQHGHLAVGLSGADGHIVRARQLSPELGLVGVVDKVDIALLVDLIEAHYIPVIASVGVGVDGNFYNVNADIMAGEIAATIGAHKVIFLTDVDGLYKDFHDKSTLIGKMYLSDARAMLADDTLSKGMIPKIQACTQALSAGVARAHILNGTLPHSLLLEIFTDEGVGTMILPDKEDEVPDDFTEYPAGELASKLHSQEN
ncbi:MAG: acetylglutamate kinase [Coriobacteriia bacterium]|nr:acetylglutamate kinase [Coriobacteriia bacterium]